MTHIDSQTHFRKKLISVQDHRTIVWNMQSFMNNILVRDSGYFHLWISGVKDELFFRNNTDKAFFLSLIQDSLSPRTRLADYHFDHRDYAHEIDLLAYSLTTNGVHLLIYTKRKTAIEELGEVLLLNYAAYIHQDRLVRVLPFDSIFIFDSLAGRHEALGVSREIHLLHEDWRNDRYSSIGFYLDDRRGDWMRPLRVTALFDSQPRHYLEFINSRETEKDRLFEFLET
jgi:hypothetical protein